jgi:hypothetical protein
MFVNALIHKTQLRYTFFRAIFTHKPNYGILFAKLPLLTKPQLSYPANKTLLTNPNYVALHLEMKSITHKNPIMT